MTQGRQTRAGWVTFAWLPFAALFALTAFADTATAQDPAGYTVKAGDLLSVSVWKEPDLQREALVRPDGSFSFPLVGEVDARGKTVADLTKIVSQRLGKYISDPVVTVSVQEIKGNKIYVIGQVNKPGEFVVNPSVDVMQALSMAGGTTPFAALGDIVILRRTTAGKQALPFKYNDVARGRNLQQNIDLQSGDVVVVP
ncbi:MAG TPA: polysaccharide biosynthesis/export family protein [Steroidobacteraceae bacterium]|nr:polysaccharide biosynthesis/export family protein [Steroidobacteraceae bacterium]